MSEARVDEGLAGRRSAYATLSTQLAHLNDMQLRKSLATPRAAGGPWGVSYAAQFGSSRVFVKRIPLTDRETSRPWSTRNHFRLPTYYNYGFGSAGFGAYRELVAQIATTNWVLDAKSGNFPTLLHHRVMDRKLTRPPDEARIAGYVRRWNGSRAVGEFLRARATAAKELWLVLEHIPHAMSQWLMNHQDRVDEVLAQLFQAIGLLRSNGIVHFDVHFANVLTDGATVYLADFGLANDTGYHLTKSEQDFLGRHAHYDYGSATLAIGIAPMWRLWELPKGDRSAVMGKYPWLQGIERQREFVSALLENLEHMTTGPLAISPRYAETLRRYSGVILHMAAFFDAMWESPRKNVRHDDAEVRRLLTKAGAPVN